MRPGPGGPEGAGSGAGESAPVSGFAATFARWNGLDAAGFARWDFLPGMRFGERAAWWRDGADRGAPHEGLDLLWYRTRGGRREALGPGARVPVLYAGEVVAVVADFLALSVFVAHPWRGRRGRLHTVYGHVAPRPGLAVGGALPEGGEVGVIAAPAPGRGVAAPPHLHLTVALVAGGPGPLGWRELADRARSTLLDPLPLLGPAP